MALSNAERQRLYRERLKAAARGAGEKIDPAEVQILKEQWEGEKRELKRQLKEAKKKAKDAKAAEIGVMAQLAELRRELASLRDERDTLQWEVRRNERAGSALALTAQDIADRQAIMAEPIWPVPKETDDIPRFLGWSRYEWSVAPEPLIDFFGMRKAYTGWKAERAEMDRQIKENSKRSKNACARIIAEHGERARAIISRSGEFGLLTAYKEDPTLGKKTPRRVT